MTRAEDLNLGYRELASLNTTAPSMADLKDDFSYHPTTQCTENEA